MAPPSCDTQSMTLSAIDRDNERRKKVYKVVEAAELQKEGIIYDIRQNHNDNDITRAVREALMESQSSTMFPREFYEYLNYKFSIFDVEAILFPYGFYGLPAGLIEDCLLYTMCNHKLLSCVFVPQGSPIGGMENLQIFIIRASLAFALTSFLGPFLITIGIARNTHSPIVVAVNVFCVSPVAMAVEVATLRFTKTFTSVDAQNPTFKLKHPVYSFLLLSLSRVSVLLILGACLFLLVVASYFSTQPEPSALIFVYLLQVLLPSALFDLAKTLLALYPYGHINVSLMSKVPLLVIGKT